MVAVLREAERTELRAIADNVDEKFICSLVVKRNVPFNDVG